MHTTMIHLLDGTTVQAQQIDRVQVNQVEDMIDR